MMCVVVTQTYIGPGFSFQVHRQCKVVSLTCINNKCPTLTLRSVSLFTLTAAFRKDSISSASNWLALAAFVGSIGQSHSRGGPSQNAGGVKKKASQGHYV